VTAPLVFRVVGSPGPQGSKTWRPNGSMQESSKLVKPWRQDVRDAAKLALETHPSWPPGGKRTGYQVVYEFVLHRPVGTVKAHPGWSNKGADLDKLARSTGDALTEAGVYPDDRAIFDLHATKRLADPGEATGCRITVGQVTW
jgi:Holliday junction resolvase RusA-like endonuclease